MPVEVGVGLGRGPDAEHQVVGIDGGDLPAVDPGLDALDVVFGLAIELFDQIAAQVGGAVHDFAGEHLGGERQVAGDADLRANVATEHFTGLAVRIERSRSLQDGLDDAFQNLAVEVLLGFEVVVDVGLGQSRLGCDVAGFGRSEAFVGEFLTGGTQDQLFVALADSAHKPGDSLPVLAVAHGITGLARRSRMHRRLLCRAMLLRIHCRRKPDSWQEAVCWC
ncbi:hypothetical protein D3C81_1228820 [compost metagenome]